MRPAARRMRPASHKVWTTLTQTNCYDPTNVLTSAVKPTYFSQHWNTWKRTPETELLIIAYAQTRNRFDPEISITLLLSHARGGQDPNTRKNYQNDDRLQMTALLFSFSFQLEGIGVGPLLKKVGKLAERFPEKLGTDTFEQKLKDWCDKERYFPVTNWDVLYNQEAKKRADDLCGRKK